MIVTTLIISYFVFLAVIGWLYSKKVHTGEDFAVAGRTLPVFVVFGTMLATWIGTGSIFGHAEKTYRIGLAAWVILLGDIVGILFLTYLAPRARRFAKITVQDVLEERYHVAARVIGSITLLIAYVTIVSYQYRAASSVLTLVWPNLSPQIAIGLVVTFIILFTAFAGMYSVAYTDTIMGMTMIIGLGLTLPALWGKAGGLEGMRASLPADHFRWIGTISLKETIALFLPGALLVLGDANMYQRFFSAKNESVARRATWWMLIGVIAVEMTIVLTALAASALEWNNPNLVHHGRVIAIAARDYLSPVLSAVLMTTILAIIMDTATSYLLAPATSLVQDIYRRFFDSQASPRKMVWMSRLFVVVLGLLAYYLSTLSDQFLSVALYAYTIYGTGITPALVAAFVWKRATTPGAICSMVGGTGMTLFWELTGLAASTGIDAVFPAAGLSLLLLVAVSLGTPQNNKRI
ncbi:MAG: sodium:solute symporter family protein [Deltaproteobacteria bacterium]|nr:sodium:solute symporter family protein [Deltaproteobacteria bacterium]MBI4373871.1 sodium:solute symporter family protein [Deltaproteobacteria bacterium]